MNPGAIFNLQGLMSKVPKCLCCRKRECPLYSAKGSRQDCVPSRARHRIARRSPVTVTIGHRSESAVLSYRLQPRGGEQECSGLSCTQETERLRPPLSLYRRPDEKFPASSSSGRAKTKLGRCRGRMDWSSVGAL